MNCFVGYDSGGVQNKKKLKTNNFGKFGITAVTFFQKKLQPNSIISQFRNVKQSPRKYTYMVTFLSWSFTGKFVLKIKFFFFFWIVPDLRL